MRVLRLAVLCVSVLLAGCNDQAAAKDDSIVPEDAFDDVPAEATSDTGVIRGIVVDDAIRPLADAKVEVPIPGGKPVEATTTANGVFAFDGLTPGTYFLKVSKVGYQPIQQSTDVAAGVDEPALVRVMLVADPGLTPFLEEFKLDGFIQCGGLVLILTFWVACTQLAEANNAPGATYTIEGNVTAFQSEMYWEPNTPLASQFWMAWNFGGVTGTSPLIYSTNGTALGDAGDEGGEIGFTAWPIGMEEAPVGFMFQQDFQAFTFVFHNYAPPSGWTFGADGPYPPPS